MKVVVIAALERNHLASSLDALSLWVEPHDVVVVNNATIPQVKYAIDPS